MRRFSGVGKRSEKYIQRESNNSDTTLSCSDSIGESSCTELFTIIACLICILITFSVAFFLPELATSWDNTVGNYIADERMTPSHEVRRFRSVSWRNSSTSGCAMSCLEQNLGGHLYIQPFAHSYQLGKKDQWMLSHVVKNARCSDVELFSTQSKGSSKGSLFLGSLETPFDTRLLDHRGLVLVAEMRQPSFELVPGSQPASKHRSTSISIRQHNYNARVLANIHNQHNEFAKSTIRFAKRVLSSFDLVLIGEWEKDAMQRRSLANTIFGYSSTKDVSDLDIALKFGLPNIDQPVLPFNTLPRHSDFPRDIDSMLYNHALNMSGSATKSHYSSLECHLEVTLKYCRLMKNSDNVPRYLTSHRVCGLF